MIRDTISTILPPKSSGSPLPRNTNEIPRTILNTKTIKMKITVITRYPIMAKITIPPKNKSTPQKIIKMIPY
jgi:hypothetical protein